MLTLTGKKLTLRAAQDQEDIPEIVKFATHFNILLITALTEPAGNFSNDES